MQRKVGVPTKPAAARGWLRSRPLSVSATPLRTHPAFVELKSVRLGSLAGKPDALEPMPPLRSWSRVPTQEDVKGSPAVLKYFVATASWYAGRAHQSEKPPPEGNATDAARRGGMITRTTELDTQAQALRDAYRSRLRFRPSLRQR